MIRPKGVYMNKNKKRYIAMYRFRGKRIYLGTYNTEIQAVKAYAKAAKKYARLFPENKLKEKKIIDKCRPCG